MPITNMASYSKFTARKDHCEMVLAGLSTDEWLPVSEVAKRLGLSINRANHILNSLSSSEVERKEQVKPTNKYATRTLWRKRGVA